MLPNSDLDLLDFIQNQTSSNHIILIDPDAQSSLVAAERCVAAILAGSRMIFVGGSTGTNNNNVDETIIFIQNAIKKKVIILLILNFGMFQLFYFQLVLMPFLRQLMVLLS